MFIRTRLYQLFLGRLLGLLQASVGASGELVLELLNPPGRVNKLQLARIKRMARAANVDFQFSANTASFERIATAATNGCLLVLGMNISLHESSRMDLLGEWNCRLGLTDLSTTLAHNSFRMISRFGVSHG